jgi:putative heme iron utilization protein
MQTTDDPAYAARQLWAGAFRAVLSTHSLDEQGYPFGSVVPYVLDDSGHPLLLLSHLSQHTRNIDADSRCGFLVAEAGAGDIQQLARLSALGDTRAIDATVEAERYFACFPQARPYFEQLGFRFYRFEAARFHWNGGFATARWFGCDRILRRNPLNHATQNRIIAHMNQDHADTLCHYLERQHGTATNAEVVMVGIDAEGIDLRCGDRLQRLPLPRPVATADEARAALVEMAQDR